jgi:hypothetical protein
MKAHNFMKANKGYSRGAQFLMNRYGSRISNPHVRGLVQQGINKLGQSGYGRYCAKYAPRSCQKQMVKTRTNGEHYYRCGKYSARACVKKRTPVKSTWSGKRVILS